MSCSIPLVRASTAIPWVLALRNGGVAPGPLLRECGLPENPEAQSWRAVGSYNMAAFFCATAAAIAPDVGCRAGTIDGFLALPALAVPIRRARTVREGLVRLSHALPCQVSHESLSSSLEGDRLVIRNSLMIGVSAAAVHQIQQLAAAQLLALLGLAVPDIREQVRVRLRPHPEFGLAHLAPWLGPNVSASDRVMELSVPADCLDKPLAWPADNTAAPDSRHAELIAQGSLTESALVLIAGMFEDGEARLDLLACAAGRSRRTMQRQLAEEGVTFVELVDQLRRQRAIAQLNGSQKPIGDIAGDLGFSTPSSLTRAVRRWTDACPREYRQSRSANIMRVGSGQHQ